MGERDLKSFSCRACGAVSGAVLLTMSCAAFAQDGCFTESKGVELDDARKRSVVITDPDVLKGSSKFTFANTIDAIIKSVPGMENLSPEIMAAERVSFLMTMLRSFRGHEQLNRDGGLHIKMSDRKNEASLDPVKLLNDKDPKGMRPVGLFNRLDLAPADWSYCGEHRIVYGLGDGSDRLNRFFLIFEAGVDNPDPQKRQEGCRPIAEFWDSLKTKTGAELRQSLERFYYEGLDAGGTKVRPVIHHMNFGVPFGQVRGNLFMTGGDHQNNPWELREWRVSLGADGAPAFTVDTVKNNPLPDLYRAAGNSANAAMAGAFQNEFIMTHVGDMTALDQLIAASGKKESGEALLAKLGVSIPNKYNTFESVSHDQRENPRTIAGGTAFAGRIDKQLVELKVADACKLTNEHLLNRMGAMTCGGCHQFTADQDVAPQVRWPKSLDFVHVDEKGALSEALEKHFLAARRESLEKFLKREIPVVASAPMADTLFSMTVRPRETLQRVLRAESKVEKLETGRDLEVQVRDARNQDRLQPGAFVPVRRVH